jgi:hypothetical protein
MQTTNNNNGKKVTTVKASNGKSIKAPVTPTTLSNALNEAEAAKLEKLAIKRAKAEAKRAQAKAEALEAAKALEAEKIELLAKEALEAEKNKALNAAKEVLKAERKEKAEAKKAQAKAEALEAAKELVKDFKAEHISLKKLMALEVNGKTEVKFEVTQAGKNPFIMSQTAYAPAKAVHSSNLSKKVAFAMAETLYKQAAKALIAKDANNGKYLSAFRPTATFLVTVRVNGYAALTLTETKGLDAIKLMDNNGKLISRSLLVAKFDLISNMANCSETFKQLLNFDAETEALINS